MTLEKKNSLLGNCYSKNVLDVLFVFLLWEGRELVYSLAVDLLWTPHAALQLVEHRVNSCRRDFSVGREWRKDSAHTDYWRSKTPTQSQPSCDGAADRNPTVKGSTEQACLCWNCSCWPHCFSLNALVVCEDADHHTEKKCVKLRL